MVEFSDILTAVKPKERTDEFVILAAMFCLNAHKAPVKTSEISTLLKLHLSKKHLPKNPVDRLRKSKSYVRPSKPDGKLLNWSLNEAGIERLRTITKLQLSTADKAEEYQSDIGIICALEHPELEAVLHAFGGKEKWNVVGDATHTHVYRETEITTDEGQKLRIVATTSTAMGLTAAAIATTQLILQYKPRLVMMIGIAAGTRAGDKQFGDILVADPSVDYMTGKVVEKDGKRLFQPDPYPLGLIPRIRSLLQKYGYDPKTFKKIRDNWPDKKPDKMNRLHIGPVGAADQVVDDATRVVEIQQYWRKLIGVEMETYGVYRAAHEAPEPKPRFVSFKAVCDFAAEKSDSWQAYASYMAANFAYEFIKCDWSSLWPKKKEETKND